MQDLIVEGKFTISKTSAISKIKHSSLVTNALVEIINRLNKVQKESTWNGSNQKIKLSTL